MSGTDRVVRIGCGGGFWGDSAEGAVQLVRSGEVDFLIVDYLAEITMALLGRQRARDEAAGFVPDFVSLMRRVGAEAIGRGIRIVVNAGGVNPQSCRAATAKALRDAGIAARIGLVSGDDLSGRDDLWPLAPFGPAGAAIPPPRRLWSANAYLGAFPIARALDAGAQIVITGRCVDSALALGPLIHAFGWTRTDYDRLAAGSLAGHLIECGAQVTGGIMTDWDDGPGWDDMGFPIAACHADGSFDITKPAGTGGRVCVAGVAEQLIYEIGDPAAYLLPDVTCDFTDVTLKQAGPDLVRVDGTRGRAPTDSYKVCATWPDGMKAVGSMMIGGRDAPAKARAVAKAVLARSARIAAAAGLPGFRRTRVEVIGAEDSYGPHAQPLAPREVTLRVAIDAADKTAAEIFSREFLPSATAMAQGITGFAGGRPAVSPLIRLGSALVKKAGVPVTLSIDDQADIVLDEASAPTAAPPAPSADPIYPPIGAATATVPLIALAYGRSGDKGNDANIGVIARDPAFLPVIGASLTPDALAAYFAHLGVTRVSRFVLPGISAFNLILSDALDGGGTISLRSDAQGKALAQMLMDFPVAVPAAWIAADGSVACVKH